MKPILLFAFVFYSGMALAQQPVPAAGSLNAGNAPETYRLPKTPQKDSFETRWDEINPDVPARPVNGTKSFQLYLARNATYPMFAKVNGITGHVVYQFIVDTTGRIQHVVILKDIGGGCGDMVKRTIENYPDNWIPATKGDRAVKSYYTGVFNFTLSGQSKKRHKSKKAKK